MRSYRKTIIATAVAATLALLTACTPDESDAEYEQRFKTNVVAQATMDQSNIEKDAAYRLTRELRAADPSIQSVDPIIVNGQRTIEISRSREDGSVEVWKMDPEKYAAMMASASNEGPAAASSDKLAKPKDESSAFGSAFGGALTGAIVGSIAGQLIGNMFSPNQGVTRGFSNYSQYAQYNGEQRRSYTSNLSSAQAMRYDKERERERRGGGGYVSPFIGQHAATSAAAAGNTGYKYGGVSAGAPSRTVPSSSATAAGRGASTQAFSSGARGSVSSS